MDLAASIQAVTTGSFRAVEFIKQTIKLDGAARASVDDSRKVVEICTQYAQKGMLNIFLVVLFSTLAFALAVVAPLALRAQERPFIGVRVDQDRNKVLLEVTPDRIGKDFLHQTVLATGGGVGALGLDRGQTGGSAVVRLERRGKRLVLVRDNWSVRALGASEAGEASQSDGATARDAVDTTTRGAPATTRWQKSRVRRQRAANARP